MVQQLHGSIVGTLSFCARAQVENMQRQSKFETVEVALKTVADYIFDLWTIFTTIFVNHPVNIFFFQFSNQICRPLFTQCC